MKKSRLILGLFVVSALLFSGCTAKNTEQDLRKANDQFYSALNTMFTGDVEPINTIWSHRNSITYMGPFGGSMTGWDAIGAEFKKTASMKLGGKVVCSNVHFFAGSDLGFAVCVEVGENISSEGKFVSVSHRATNIFQLQDGNWKLIHHHTDLAPQLEKAFEKGSK